MRRIAVVVLLSLLALGGLVLSQRAGGRGDRVAHATPITTVRLTTTVQTTTETTPPPPPSITVPQPPLDYAAWTRVAICEEGGWVGASGPAYPNSLGIKAANWYRFGGGTDVSPMAQILVADRLIAHYRAGMPDQDGCTGSW
jgi:hypothetical protein